MSDHLDGAEIRRTLLEVIAEKEKKGAGFFQSQAVLTEAAGRLGLRGDAQERALLDSFQDLFRVGLLGWGHNLGNSESPFLHTTEVGRLALSQLSRDPYNPSGYRAVTALLLHDYPVAASYLDEAVAAFQHGLLRATAVVLGGAGEALLFSLRDAVLAFLNGNAEPVPSKLQSDKAKTVRDALFEFFRGKKSDLGYKLWERFSGSWMSITDQIRITRNDAGHPKSLGPVTHETVHASLLLFPTLARLVGDLHTWLQKP